MQRLIVWAVSIGLALEQEREERLPESVYKNLRLAQMEMDMPWNVWKSIRKLDEITQFQMAEILGINIKRYVRLENEIIGPDAEILYRLYSELSYIPCVVMSSLKHTLPDEVRQSEGHVLRSAFGYYLTECSDAWDYFSEEVRNRLIPILSQGLELIRRVEERN